MDTAVIDACVLFRGGARDFLLWVAEAGAFSPAWSDAIHDEWMRNRRHKFGDPFTRLNHARVEMEKAFPGANVEPDRPTLRDLALPDLTDVPVVATAVAAEASSIVTYNGRHFPGRILVPLGLRAETPDEFCVRLFDRAPAEVIEGARLHRASLKRPAYDRRSYLDHLAALGFERTVDLLTLHTDSI